MSPAQGHAPLLPAGPARRGAAATGGGAGLGRRHRPRGEAQRHGGGGAVRGAGGTEGCREGGELIF